MVKFFNGLEGCGGGGEWLGQLGDRWWSSWVETMVVLWCSGEGGMMEGKGVRGGFICWVLTGV